MKRTIFVLFLVAGLVITGRLLAIQQPGSASSTSPGRTSVIVEREYSGLFDLYRQLHFHPELSFHEIKTAARVAEELEKAGFQVTRNFGGTGVVGILKNGSGPTVMIRTDLDALPVVEETGLEYASQVRTKDDQGREVGVMHACGHDMHMTCFVGAARVLSQLKNQWQGTLIMIGQPAEERSGGAKGMLAQGLFQKFSRPDFILALHNDATLETGKIGIREGNALAGIDSVDLTVRGVSGHGGYPYAAKDPIVLAAQIILSLQTIVSRELRAIDPAVVTVGSIHGGTKHNIIPNEVQLQLTVRHYSDQVRNQILKSIDRIAQGTAQAAGIPPKLAPIMKVLEEEYLPPTYNDPELTRRTARALTGTLGDGNVVPRDPVMGGEDFTYFGRTPEKIPICMFWLGTVNPQRMAESRREGGEPLPSLHSSRFAPDPETTIKTGVTAMAAAALDLLGQ